MKSLRPKAFPGLLLATLLFSACGGPEEAPEVEAPKEQMEPMDEVADRLETRLTELEREVGNLRSQAEMAEENRNLYTELAHLEGEIAELRLRLDEARATDEDWTELGPAIARDLEEVEAAYVDLQRIVQEIS